MTVKCFLYLEGESCNFNGFLLVENHQKNNFASQRFLKSYSNFNEKWVSKFVKGFCSSLIKGIKQLLKLVHKMFKR